MTYNLAYAFAFEVSSDNSKGSDLTGHDLREAILQRLSSLSDDEVRAACDAPFDCMEVATK